MLQHIETNKLFYNEYLYALKCQNPLSTIFRSPSTQSTWTRMILDRIRPYFEEKVPISRDVPHYIREDISNGRIKYKHFRDAQTIYKSFTEKFASKEFKVRIDFPNTLKIYANDKVWLLELATRIDCAQEFCQPDPKYADILIDSGHIILVDKRPDYKWKVKFNNNKVDKSFGNWCKNNPDKVKISANTIDYIDKGYSLDGCFMYVRDKSILTLVSIMVGNNLGRTDELVYCKDLDK